MGMKGTAAFVALFGLFCCTKAFSETEKEKWFINGHLEAGITWPHNELGVNLRRPAQSETNGFGDNFGRYALRGQLFLGYRVNRCAIENVFVVVKPYFVFGRTIPQLEYTWSFRYIGHVKNYGVGITLSHDWKLYLETHRWRFRDKLAVPADGPFELHNMFVVRKEFELSF